MSRNEVQWLSLSRLLTLHLALAASASTGAAINAADPVEEVTSGPRMRQIIEKIEDDRIENLYSFGGQIISGAQPANATAFEALQDLGIKTIVCVDGAIPNADLAGRYGMRYIHIPIGYNHINENKRMAMGKAVRSASGPVYVHCHHGRHRGPASAAIMKVMLGKWTAEQGIRAMQTCGTSPKYKGLYQEVRTASAVDEKILLDYPVALTSKADTPPLVQAMVNIQSHFDRLAACRENQWGVPAEHPDVSPPHEALQLREILHEINRVDTTGKYPPGYHERLKQTEAAAAALEAALQAMDTTKAEEAWAEIRSSCSNCHAEYRTGPKILKR